MALLWADSFENNDQSKYDALHGQVIFTTNGRHGNGAVLGDDPGTQAGFSIYTSPSGDTHIIGIAVRVTDQTSGNRIVTVINSGTSVYSISWSPSNGWYVLGQSGFTWTSATGGRGLLNTWEYVEVKCKRANPDGRVELRVDGNVIDVFNGNTQAGAGTTWDEVQVGGQSGGDLEQFVVDDFVVMDGSGTNMNDFLGSVWVQSLRPSADGSLTQLTGSDGDSTNNYLQVDEDTASSTDYNGSTSTGQKDYYAFPAISKTTGTQVEIFGAQVWGFLGKEAGANAYGRLLVNDGTTSAGTSISLSSGYTHEYMLLNTLPGGSTFTTANSTTLEVGFEVLAST